MARLDKYYIPIKIWERFEKEILFGGQCGTLGPDWLNGRPIENKYMYERYIKIKENSDTYSDYRIGHFDRIEDCLFKYITCGIDYMHEAEVYIMKQAQYKYGLKKRGQIRRKFII